MINEWTLLIVLLLPIAAFVVGGICITAWAQTQKLVSEVSNIVPQKTTRQRAIAFQNASH